MSAAVVPSTGAAPNVYRGYRANEFAAFLQDDWRLTNRLTLNLGLRWEYFGPPHNFQPGVDSNFYFGTNITPFDQLCKNSSGVYVSCTSLGVTQNPFFPGANSFYGGVQNGNFQIRNNEIWNKDTNNFGPRIGFAWDALGNQKMVIRGGFGLMYDRIYNNVFENIRFNPPFFSDNQIGYASGTGVMAGAVSTPGLLSYPFATRDMYNNPVLQPKPNPRHMDQNAVAPYYEQMHLGIQWEFARGYVFEPEYVGTFGHKLLGLSDINTYDGRVAGLGSSNRINPYIGADNYRSNGFASNYHALQLNLRKTYSAGLSMNLNYTYSKALDDMSDVFNNRAGAHPTDNMNFKIDYGPADFDLRHRFVGTVSYELPFMKANRWIGGWGVNSIVSVQTGHPISIYSSSSRYDLNKDGYRTDRLVPVGSPASTVLGSGAANACTNEIVAGGGTGKCYFDTTKWMRYVCPASVNGGLWCNPPIGRNSLYGPHAANVDFNLTKKFKLTERAAITFQANFFDLFNHPNFLPPGSGANELDAGFGEIKSTWGDSGGHRVTQLALRFDF